MQNKKRRVTIRTYPTIFERFSLLCMQHDQTKTDRLVALISWDVQQPADLSEIKIGQQGEKFERHLAFNIDSQIYTEFRYVCHQRNTRPERRMNQLILIDIDQNLNEEWKK